MYESGLGMSQMSPSSPRSFAPADAIDSFMNADFQQMRDSHPNHAPPHLDVFGFEIKTHPALVTRGIDSLHSVKMPRDWTSPSRFPTRSALRETRAASMRADKSFDCDGDGFVGAEDYAIASRHDLGQTGKLSGGQRDSAIAETCYRMGTKLHDEEIGGNKRVRRIMTSLREAPELNDGTIREQRLRVGGMAVASLKNKSSFQLKQCLKFPEAQAPEGGPAFTRSMLLEQRKAERIREEDAGHHHYLRSLGYE